MHLWYEKATFLWFLLDMVLVPHLSRRDVESRVCGSGMAGPHRECQWQRKKGIAEQIWPLGPGTGKSLRDLLGRVGQLWLGRR